ncbi:MAG: right-handed parallel beta-helix repeat-containing protein [Pseudomonadota bacterium]
MGICKFSSQSGVYRRVKRLGALARAVAGLGLVISILIAPGALTAHAYTDQDNALSLEDAMVQQARNGRWLQKQIGKAKRGDVVSIPAGTYNVQDLKIFKTIKLVGQGEVVLQSLNPVSKGLLVPDLGVSLHVENITFRGARARDRNGAGIRHDGKDLWVINCVFDSNEDGILATGSEDGRLEIRNSTFVNNGHGDGFSHGIYLSSGAQMLVYDSRFLGTKIGHHIKSLAQVTAVTGSYFDDVMGRSSYTIDVTRGGLLSFTGNFVRQRATAENATLINYDASRGGTADEVRIVGNHFVNHHPSARLIRNPTPVKASLSDNQITNEGRGRLSRRP